MKNTKNIAVLNFYAGNFERGVEVWTAELAKSLSPKFKISLYQNGGGKNPNISTFDRNIKTDWSRKSTTGTLLRRVFFDYWSRKIAVWTFSLIRELLSENYDIVIPTNGGWQVAMIRLVTWIKGTKMVLVGHSGPGWDDRINLWAFPDVFIALNKYNSGWAKKVNPFVKTVCIANGVDTKKFNPQGKKIPLKLKKPVVIAVGALEKEKRLELTIKAVAKLESVSLLILGKGSLRKEIENLGKKLLAERFELNHADYANIADYYRAADAFTLPSWEYEAFGIVYLEAMATGLPVVATDEPGRRELVGEAGILVDPENIDNYSKAIDEALSRKWDGFPRKQAGKYSWNNISVLYENLFDNLLK